MRRLSMVSALGLIAAGTAAWWLAGSGVGLTADPPTMACQAQIANVQAKVGGRVTAVSGAFAVPAASVANWQERRGPPDGPRVVSLFRQAPATEMLNVCFLDGLFLAPHGPIGSDVRPPYDRLVVIVGPNGKLTLDTATWQTVFPVVDPSKF